MSRQLIAALLLSVVTALAAAPLSAATPTLEDITRQLQISDELDGDFVQRKYLSVLPNPLLSRGQFSFRPDTGLVWETRQPLHSRLIFSGEGILQEQNGQQTWLARADQPGVAVIGEIMTAILTRDWDTLKEFFTLEIAADTTDDHWSLVMTPTQSTLAAVITRIALSGDQHLRHMTLLEHSGDRTEIDFIPATEQDSAPADAQSADPQPTGPQSADQ